MQYRAMTLNKQFGFLLIPILAAVLFRDNDLVSAIMPFRLLIQWCLYKLLKRMCLRMDQ